MCLEVHETFYIKYLRLQLTLPFLDIWNNGNGTNRETSYLQSDSFTSSVSGENGLRSTVYETESWLQQMNHKLVALLCGGGKKKKHIGYVGKHVTVSVF